jgi:uncharacterized membrane protein YhaH (DUF805 family)
MRKYFYTNGQHKEGPVNLEELKKKEITPQTLIWYEGLEDWKVAESVEELREIFELNPPTLDIENAASAGFESHQISSEDDATTKTKVFIKKQRMFSNPFSFDGRIRRTEYGITLIIFVFVIIFLDPLLKTGQHTMLGLLYIPLYLFLWAQGAKRCHDIGNNGWWQIIPFYVFWLIFAKANMEINQYGRNPKF